MLKARSGHSVASSGGYLYVAGGEGHRDMERYDPTTDSWALVTSSVALDGAMGRHACGLVAVGGFLYIIGGPNAPKGLQRYDPKTDSWTVMASMSAPRTSHSVAAE